MAKKSVFSRSVSLLGMATKVASKELGSRILGEDAAALLATRINQAKIVAEHLSNLKGAAMKAGQLLSLDTSDFLPPEAIEILSTLQAKAAAHPTEDMKRILLLELGREKYAHVRQFSEKPKASASIGQLHSATLEVPNTPPRPVAVKIQYPGVPESIDSDLAILKKLALGFVSVSGKKFSLDETFQELSGVLKRETDYEIERLNLEKYQALLMNSPDYVVPSTYPDYCTKKVLTMSWEEGLPVLDWIKSGPSKELKKKVGHLVLDLFCREFADWGFVQTDPNFGNFLIRQDTQSKAHSDVKLVCLDFGAALSYDEPFRRGYANMLLGLKSDDTEKIFKSAVEFGLIDPRESLETQEAFKKMIQSTMEPFNPDRQPFVFSDPHFEKRTIETNRAFVKSLVYSPPPRKILFLHRKLGGIFNLVKRLDVALDLGPYWQKMTAPANQN